MSVRFQFEWVEVPPSPITGDWRTMAALSIRARDEIVTEVVNRPSKTYQQHVVIPLLHVAEWLVSHWWSIWYEIPATDVQRPGFTGRHNLAEAGDGFVLPDLEITASMDQAHLRWTQWIPEYSTVKFVSAGEVSVDRAELEEEFRNVIESVLERLSAFKECQAYVDRLSSEWEAVNNLDAEELEFCRAAALLGIDPFEVDEGLADHIMESWARIDPSIRVEALASSHRSNLGAVCSWLDRGIEKLAAAPNHSRWTDIRREVPRRDVTEPWDRGYGLARWVRRELGLGEGRFDFRDRGRLAFKSLVAATPARHLQGVVSDQGPACVTAPRRPAGQRFLQARALGDYLGRTGPGFGILSSLVTDRQAISRAFAAEFLAPAAALQARLPAHVDDEAIYELASEFNVSRYVIRHQIQNQLPDTLVSNSYSWR